MKHQFLQLGVGLTLSMGLVGCAGSNSNTSVVPPCSYQAQQDYGALAARPQGLRLAVLGSSSTQGAGAPTGKGYVDLIRQTLTQRGWNVDVQNYGVGGETTLQMAQRWARTAPASLDLLIVQPMANDVLQQRTLQQAQASLQVLSDVLKDKPYDIAVLGTQYLGAKENEQYPHKKEIDTLLQKWAKTRAYPYIDRSLWTQQQADPASFLAADKIHPNELGHALITHCVLKTLFVR